MGRYICIHGHFYQPPRENAWLEEIELQESAHPYHDWNERINEECYGPNTASRILNEEKAIIDIWNNYARMSFNFGPTLLSWLENKAPDTYEGILQADILSRERFSGHGSALAQVYNHMIMPLANRRDKETQVIWGIRDFEYRFKRFPEGMWLAETAVDTETLEILAAQDIRFTILAPHQAKLFRYPGQNDWLEPNGNQMVTRAPYVCKLPSGREIVLFFYNGEVSRAVAFNHLLNDGKAFANSLLNGFDDSFHGDQLVHIATDGESYGHHHFKGDMALAYGIEYIEKGKLAELTNYGEFIEKSSFTGECQIIENTSWSCVHGIERWRSDCGCHTGGKEGWNQAWRKPLRETLDWLRDEINKYFEEQAGIVLNDPWESRNKYIEVILDRESNGVNNYLNEYPEMSDQVTAGVRWLELQRHAMLMYTSCGWFFDEVSGIETTQLLQYAGRAIQLLNQLTGKDLEDEFIERLKGVPSNDPAYGDAAKLYVEQVMPTRLSLDRVGMHYAVSALFEKDPGALDIFNYKAENLFFERYEAGVQKLVIGVTSIRSNVTYSEKKFIFATLYLGQHNMIGNIAPDMEQQQFDEMHQCLKKAFEESRLGDIIGLMQTYFGPKKYTLWHLFKDQKRKVISQILDANLRQVGNSLRKIYNSDYPLINMMKASEIPIPRAYRMTLEYVHNADLIACFKDEFIDLAEMDRIWLEFEKWNIAIDDKPAMEKLAGERVEASMKKILEDKSDLQRLVRVNEFFMYMEKFGLEPQLSRSQNLYFYIAKNVNAVIRGDRKKWSDEFLRLGENMKVKVEVADVL